MTTFPKRITIDLPEFQRSALEEIADRVSHETDSELLQVVISRGIVAVLASEFEQAGSGKSELSARATRPFPAPSVLFKKRQREIEEGKSDLGFSNAPGDEPKRPVLHRHIERYLATPISERLRQRFEDYLDAHPGMDEEEALTTLLQRAFDQADKLEDQERSAAVRKAEAQLRLAERLYRRALDRRQP